MNAPITPPSKRIVRPGHRSCCASVAARSGMPTPANTTCPSRSCRALSTASNSAAVTHVSLRIVERPPRPCRLEQLAHTDEFEELRPRPRAVDETFEVLAHAADRIVVHEADVVLHVSKHRLIRAVALVWRAAERELHHGIHGEEWNFGVVRRPSYLFVGHDAFGRQNYAIRGHGEIDVHERQAIDLRVAERVTPLHVDQCDVRIERRHEKHTFLSVWTTYFDGLGPLNENVRSQHGSHRHERHAHRTGTEAHADGKVTPFLIARLAGLDVMPHDFRDAPQDALTEPARDD